MVDRRHTVLIACITISLFTLLIYWQVQDFKFVFYDDNAYITEKPFVRAGITWEGIKWAFTATEAGFWHPLTWLSLMLDSELFRLNTGGYHWTNVILHLLSSIIFFLFLYAATGKETLSFLCALLFAAHPLHVESVAWVSQRKDVLSTLFGFASLLAYVYYAGAPHWGRYLLVLILFILALMAKPMVVTFPVVMCLLDFWPLKRFPPTPVRKLLAEKIPFFILSALASLLVIYTEKKIGAITSFAEIGIGMRMANALVSYVKYIFLTVFPTNLAFFYPYPDQIPAWQWLSALIVLIAITGATLYYAKKYPYLATGWFWYVITLFPVCGIIQVGPHAMADRYSYVTINGLFIMAVWGTAELAKNTYRRIIFTAVWAIAVLIFSYVAWQQTGYWKNTETLMKRALRVTEKNWIAYNNLGIFLTTEGKFTEALGYLEKAVQIKPGYSIIHYNLGLTLNAMKEHEKALIYLKKALEMGFKPEDTLLQIGLAHEKMGNWQQAIESYRAILKKQESLAGRQALAFALEVTGEKKTAEKEWMELLKMFPQEIYPRKRLLYLYLTDKRYDAAIRTGEEGVAKKAVDGELYRLLSLAYMASKDFSKSAYYRKLSESSSP